jgi:hypothetical protein
MAFLANLIDGGATDIFLLEGRYLASLIIVR